MVIDIILVVIFAGAIIYGMKKGLLKVVARLLSTIIAFGLAYILAEPVGKYIATQPFVMKNITPVINSFLNGNLIQESAFLTKVQEALTTGAILTDSALAVKIAEYIYLGIGFAVVFILVRIVLWIVVMMLDKVLELPIINTANKLAGVAISVILVYLEASIILAILQLLGTFEFMNGITQLVNSSVIANFIYDHNIVMNIIINKIL